MYDDGGTLIVCYPAVPSYIATHRAKLQVNPTSSQAGFYYRKIGCYTRPNPQYYIPLSEISTTTLLVYLRVACLLLERNISQFTPGIGKVDTLPAMG